MVFGTFALLHPGHKHLIRFAMRRGRVTIVVARTGSVVRMKGQAPVEDEGVRVAALQRTFPQANVILGDTRDFLSPVRRLRPDLIVLGYDQRLPPGIHEEDLHCRIMRAGSYRPERYKSSILVRNRVVQNP